MRAGGNVRASKHRLHNFDLHEAAYAVSTRILIATSEGMHGAIDGKAEFEEEHLDVIDRPTS